MSSEDQLRLTAQIVDQFSGPLREMTKSVHNFQDFMRGGTKQTIKDNKEHAKLQKDLNEQMIRTGRTVTGILTPAMGALGLSFGGAGASIAELITKLKTAGGEFYNIQGAMMRSGQSSKELDVLVRTMGKFGVSSAAAYESIAALGDTARKVGRGLAPELQRLESTYNDLHPLITKMAAESGADAAKDFWKFYWSTPADPDKRQTLLRAFHQDERIANITSEQWKKQNEEQQAFVNKNPDLSQKQREGLDQAFSKLSDSMDSLERALERATASFTAKAVKVLATDIDALASSVKGEPAPPFIQKGSIIDRLYFSHNLAPLAGAPGGSFKDRWSGLSDGGEKSLTEKFLKLLSHSGADLGGAGAGESFQERWSGLYGGGVSPDGEKSLTRGTKQGVLEALREYFSAEPAGGSGGAGGSSGVGGGDARRSLAARLGIDHTGGGGGTRGDRNNNRGNLKFGPLARAFGATGADDRGFAIFPDQASGDAAQDALIKSNAYSGLTLDQFGNKYAEGSADWKKTVGAGLGIGANDIVDNNDPRLMGAIRKAEGTGGGGGKFNLMGGPIGQNLKAFKTARGTTFTSNAEAGEHFKGFIDQIQAAGAPDISEIGGYNPRHIRGSNRWSQHAYGNAIDVDEQSGRSFAAFRQWASTHPKEYQEGMTQNGIKSGADFGDFGHYEWGGQKSSRDLLTNEAKAGRTGGAQKVEGSADLRVAFENAPAGAKAYMQYGGLFTSGKVDWGHAMPPSDPGGR